MIPSEIEGRRQAFAGWVADPANPLARFRSNRLAGALVAAACFVVGNA